jgi:hypothetical protein
VTLHGIFNQEYSSTMTNVESVVVYTDYENIQVKYSCIELNHFWYTEKQEKVFVLVREAALATNDKLDSTILLDTLFNKLKNQVPYDLSRLELIANSYNNKSCQVLNRQYVNYRLPTNLMVFPSFLK